MTTTQPVSSRARFWKIVLIFSAVHFLVMSIGAVSEVAQEYSGGCMFVTPAYFMVLPVMLSILLLQRFGAGTGVFLFYALFGFPPTYYFEISKMYGLWAVFAWCLIGRLVGLIGDLAFRFLPRRIPERWRAAVIGALVGAAIFATTYLALATFYRNPDLDSHFKFFATYYYISLPWLIVNGGFAGYTAYALTKRV